MTEPPLRGMILGKFMPPHRGHQLLADFARHFVDELAIVVGTMPDEPIPGALRFGWMQELFPACRVLHLDEVLPQAPEAAASVEDFWRIWRQRLLALLPWPVDWIFASEAYGPRLAQELGARFGPVDQPRTLLPVSGTAIRQQPLANWDFLPDCVRPYFVRRICLAGPESCGKSTLARRLAQHFGTRWVPEYAATLLHQQAGQIAAADMHTIARGQLAAEAALARQARRLLFCDTDLLTSVLWSHELFGACTPWLAEQARLQRYDLTLLCAPDVPWVDDLHRLRPGTREAFFQRCRAQLEAHQRPYVVVSGSWDERLQTAIQACTALLDES